MMNVSQRIVSPIILRVGPFGRPGKIAFAWLAAAAFAAPLALGLVRVLPRYDQILHATGPLPSFEVATVRPWKPVQIGPQANMLPPGEHIVTETVQKFSPGPSRGQISDRVHFIGQAELLIAAAYNLPTGSEKSRIVGAPDWASNEENRYELQGKIESSMFAAMQTMTAAQQREQVELMEQSVLADRFKLKVHFEAREMRTFALVAGKGGLKLTPAKEGEPNQLTTVNRGGEIEMTARSVSMDQLVHSPLMLSGQEIGGHPVMDQTGLKGRYDFTLRWTSPQAAGADGGQESRGDAPSFFTALQEQLGLKLVPTKAPAEVIVIDHMERPTEN